MVNKNENKVLNEILLRMAYDIGKTLSENTSDLNEQGFNRPEFRSDTDATYVRPPVNITNKKTNVNQTYKGKVKPFGPNVVEKIYQTGSATPRQEWILNYPSNRYNSRKKYYGKQGYNELREIVKQDRKEWGCKYGHDFEDWLCRNSETVHKALQYTSIGLTVIALTAASVMSGGLATPALAAYASGLGLALDLVDASLYVYEDNPREAALTFALGAVDAVQLFKSVKDISKLGGSADDIVSLQKKMRVNKGKTIEQLNKEGKLTKGELATAEALSRGKNADSIAKLAKQNLTKLALRGAKEYALKSPKHFITSLIGIIRSPITKGIPGLSKLLGLTLVIDGINLSYNFLYNVFTGDDEELQSIVMSILEAFWGETKPQVDKDLGGLINQIDSIDIDFEIKNKNVFTPESIKQDLDSIKTKRLSKEKARQVASTLNNRFLKTSLKSTGFQTREEGDKFRRWFNTNYPATGKAIDLDLSGPEDNKYIRSAYWTELSPGRYIGDIYKEQPTKSVEKKSTMG